MSATSDLAAQRSGLKARIQVLGGMPDGNPAELISFAQFLQHEADKAASFARREAAIAGRIDFVSPAATRLFANMGDVADSFSAAQAMLEHAAQMIMQRANQIADAQQDWERRRTALDGQLADLDRRASRLTT